MGQVKSELGGAISGAVGPVVFYNRNGKTYVRAAIKDRAKESWSNNQVGVRNKVKQVATLWRQLAKNPVRASWQMAAEQMSGYNLFLKINLHAFKGQEMQYDLEWLHLSNGNLPLPHQLQAVAVKDNPMKWQVSWSDDSGYMLSKPDDELLVVFAHDGKFSDPMATGVKRSQKSALVQVPEKAAKLQGLYLFFAAADREFYSVDQFVKADSL